MLRVMTPPLRFRDVSGVLHPNPPGRSYGCVIADFLGAGVPQIVVVCPAGPNRMYRFDGVRFVDEAGPVLADAGRAAIACAAADVDASGRLALYVVNTDSFAGRSGQADGLFVRVGENVWRDMCQAHRRDGRALVEPANLGAGRSACFCDLTGTGLPDLVVANYGAPSLIYLNRGHDPGTGEWLGLANIASPDHALGAPAGGRGLVAGDLFNTGRCDLLFVNEHGANRLWRNQGVTPEGDMQLRECAAELGLADSAHHARGVAMGDFDRDGRVDLVWGNWEGPHRLMFQREDGSFEDRTPAEMREPSRVRSVIAADFDNDGHLDILFINLGEPNRLFLNDGQGNFRRGAVDEIALPEGEGTGASVGDLTGNGRLDLFIAQGESEPMPDALFINETENDNHWVRVHAQTFDGAPAIGARVDIVCEGFGDDRPQTRQIDGGSGYLCQQEPVAHFGLGPATRVSTLRVRWSDGAERTLRDVPADQSLVIRPA